MQVYTDNGMSEVEVNVRINLEHALELRERLTYPVDSP